MTRRRIYIAGPINGRPDCNRAAFAAAADHLRAAGHEPVNPLDLGPHRHEGSCPTSYASQLGHSAACYLRVGCAALLTCDEVYLLDGSETSVGATREVELAGWVGIPVTAQAAEEVPT